MYFLIAFFVACFFYFMVFRKRTRLLEGQIVKKPKKTPSVKTSNPTPTPNVTDQKISDYQTSLFKETDPIKRIAIADAAIQFYETEIVLNKTTVPDRTRVDNTMNTIRRIKEELIDATIPSSPSPGTSGPSPETSRPSPETSGPSPETSGPPPGTSGPP